VFVPQEDPTVKFSVTSVSLPDLDVRETCALLQRLGFDGVEWRVRYTSDEARQQGYSFWGAHKTDLSPANLADRADEVSRITADHGLAIAGIASNLRTDEYEEIKRLADGVAKLGDVPIRLGAPQGYNRTTPYPVLYEEAVAAYARAIEILKPYGLRVLIEIHGGTIMVSPALAHRIACHFSPSEIGVIYDVNNMTRDGFETFRLTMELLGPYLQHCHAGGWRPTPGERLADGTLVWNWEPCDLQESLLDIPQWMADLQAVGYDRFISIEDFRVMDHEAKLAPQLAYLKGLASRG
jgi:sugar phosphate isomerase/epimerase